VKVHVSVTNPLVPEPFPIEMMSSAVRRLRTKVLGEKANVPGAVIRSAKDTAEAQTSPTMVDLGPILRLLTTLRPRPAQNRVHRQELSLPPGCVLAVRYASR
jgi:hypothetical protein